MDVSLVIRQRLNELSLDQRDLAAAIQVTDSYISQLLTRRKAPPAPGRTDIYDKIGDFLKLPAGQLSKLAHAQRREEFKKRAAEIPAPLFQRCRNLVLGKCRPESQTEVRRIFEKEAFGEFERLITQKLLDVAQSVAKEEVQSEEWLRLMSQLGGQSYKHMRAAILKFLEADALSVSMETCVSFLELMIDGWDIDLKSFSLEVSLNRHLAANCLRRFDFVEQAPHELFTIEPGLKDFLTDKSLSGDATEEEIEFLLRLKTRGRQPNSLYYYREMQNLRDPLHFKPKS